MSIPNIQEISHHLNLEIMSANNNFHQWRILSKIFSEANPQYATVDKHGEFWNTVYSSLLQNWVLGFNRLYDNAKGTEDLPTFVKLCLTNKGLFSIKALSERLSKCGVNESLIANTIEGKKDATEEQFNAILKELSKIENLVDETIRPIRHKALAHRSNDTTTREKIRELYEKIDLNDMQTIIGTSFTACSVISECYGNGTSLEMKEYVLQPTQELVPYGLLETTRDLVNRASKD